MISSKRNNQIKDQKGQVLLLTMMLVATVLTVFLSMSFKSTTETQVTRLEEESQKALAAAEAGIEAALKTSGEVTIGESLSGDLSGYSGSAVCSEEYNKNYFVSPLIQKDEQYTFYLADYPGLTNSYEGNLSVYYGSQTDCNNVSLELTLIYGSDNKVKRWIADANNNFGADVTGDLAGGSGGKIGGVNFNCSTSAIDLGSYTGAKLLIVRSFYAATQLGFSGTDMIKPQGKICDAYASSSPSTTTQKVTKKLYLLQSYPQIPAEFFVTSF